MVSFDKTPQDERDYDEELDALIAPVRELNEALIELLKAQLAVVIEDTSMTIDEKIDLIMGLYLDLAKND